MPKTLHGKWNDCASEFIFHRIQINVQVLFVGLVKFNGFSFWGGMSPEWMHLSYCA